MPPCQLYGFGESGNAYKAALMLQFCGLDWSQVNVDFFNGETRSAPYRTEINEMGEVPVLVDGDRKLAQSGVILTYLAEKTGKFGGRSANDRLEILSWLFFDNHKFTSYLATLRFLVALAKTGETPITEFLRLRVKAALAIAEQHLATRSFMVGEAPTIADISMCGYLFHPEDYGVAFDDFPHIQRWLARIAAIPGWKAPYDLLAKAPAKRG